MTEDTSWIITFVAGALLTHGGFSVVDCHLPGAVIGLGGFAALAYALTRQGKL